eukprot:Gb_21961 [translate_table: standard]
MDSASLIARLWLPFTEEPLPTKRIGFCEMPVCCKGHSFFTGLRPEGRGSLSRRVPRAKEAEFKFPPEYYDDVHSLLIFFYLILRKALRINVHNGFAPPAIEPRGTQAAPLLLDQIFVLIVCDPTLFMEAKVGGISAAIYVN